MGTFSINPVIFYIIFQLDAVTLDAEIFNILRNQLQTVLQNVPVNKSKLYDNVRLNADNSFLCFHFQPGILKQHEAKLDILLHYVIWKVIFNFS